MQNIRRRILSVGLLALLFDAPNFVTTSAIAAQSVKSKTCSQLKQSIKSKGRQTYRARGGTQLFVYSAFYCPGFAELTWKIIYAKDGKCYLHICVPHISNR